MFFFCICENKDTIFLLQIVQSLYSHNPQFQAKFKHLLLWYSTVKLGGTFVDEGTPRCSILRSLFPGLSCNIEILKRGFKGVFVAAHQAFLWPVHLSCASFNRVCTLCIFAFFRTSVSGILSCHLIFRSFLRQLLRWKWLSFLAWRWYTVQVSHAYKRVGSTTAL